MAEPAPGRVLSAGLFRRASGQDPRRRPGPQQGGLCRERLRKPAAQSPKETASKTTREVGVAADGRKEVLGLWIEQTEGAKFWLRVMNELKNRSTNDILIAVVDGLKGFPDAINAVFPETVVQTCIGHLIRNSMEFASWKERKPVAAALKTIYRAIDAEAGRQALDAFAASPWGIKYPAITLS